MAHFPFSSPNPPAQSRRPSPSPALGPTSLTPRPTSRGPTLSLARSPASASRPQSARPVSLPGRAHASGSSLSPRRAHATEAPRSPPGISPRLSRGTHAQKPGAPFKHPRPHPLEPKTPSRSRHHNPTSTPRLAAGTKPLRRRGAAAPQRPSP